MLYDDIKRPRSAELSAQKFRARARTLLLSRAYQQLLQFSLAMSSVLFECF